MNKTRFFIIAICILSSITVINISINFKNRHEVEQAKSIIAEQDSAINALKQYVDAQIYKKDAQLYLMNKAWNDSVIHKALADSCRNNCLTYKAKYNE